MAQKLPTWSSCRDMPRLHHVMKEVSVTDTESIPERQDIARRASAPATDEDAVTGTDAQAHRRSRWHRVVACGVAPALALLLASTAGYLKWMGATLGASPAAAAEPVHAATDGTTAILSYRPDTVEKDLDAAKDRLTGGFKDSYAALIHDVVIPAAKQKQISSVATVPAAAAVSASENHSVVMVFVNQSTVMGTEPPTNTASRVRVALDRIGHRWLIAGFDPM
jgi:Mce-associated membrane protein